MRRMYRIVSSLLNIQPSLTCVMRQCFEALAIGSVTWVQAAPKSITLGGFLYIMSKKALVEVAVLHCKQNKQNVRRGCLNGFKYQFWKYLRYLLTPLKESQILLIP